MKFSLRPGIEHQMRYVVPQHKVVAELYSEAIPMQAMPRVFATRSHRLGEWACIEAVNPHLDWPLEQTVGTPINITHEAPTPPVLAVIVTVKLVQAEGRRLAFEVVAHDGVDTITRGRHERAVIDRDRFATKAGPRVRHPASARCLCADR